MRLPAITLLLVTALGTLGGCWRGTASSEPPQPSFIARRNAMLELRRSVNGLAPRLQLVVQRIMGLSSEAERDAIGQDLVDLEREVAALSRYTVDVRSRGDNEAFLDAIDRDLERAALVVVKLREELRYAKTIAQLAALEELSRETATEPVPVNERPLVIQRVIELPTLDVSPRVRRRNAIIETP